MSVFDPLVQQVRETFRLGDRARPLTKQVVQFIASGPGGTAGFLSRLHEGEQSAPRSGAEAETAAADRLSPEQVERAFGARTLERIAAAAGLSVAEATPAIAFLAPRVLDRLAPSGIVPRTVPPEAGAFLMETEGPALYADEIEDLNRRRLRPWMWGVPALAIVVLAAVWLLGSSSEQAEVATDSAAQGRPLGTAPDTIAAIRQPDEGSGDTSAPATGDAAEDAQAAQAPERQSRAAVAGGGLARSGSPEESEQALATGAGEPSNEERLAELRRQLQSVQVIFAPNRAVVLPQSQEKLLQLALALQAAPVGTQVEIGGHTDPSGDQAENDRLARLRAEAVRDALVAQGVPADMLTVRGYGASRPIADNATPEGRSRNRRIEFTLLQ